MEVLEEDLTCPICCSLFDDPRVLPCSHNFCRKCLEGVLYGNSKNVLWKPSFFKCPTCRKETSAMGVNGHQVNYLLKGIVEKYNKIKVCPKMHECNVHSGHPLNIFCSTDLKLICGFCATNGEHKQHVFSSIEEAYKQEKNSFETLFQGFEKLNCTEMHTHLEALESNKKKALHQLTKDSDRAKVYFEKLQHLLEQKKNEILSDFETMKLAVMQTYDPEINKLHTVLNEQQKAWNIAEEFKLISDPLVFLQQMQEFREKMRLIKDAPLPSGSDLTVSHSMKNFDTSMWDNIKLIDVDKVCLPQDTLTRKDRMQLRCPYLFRAVSAAAFISVLIITLFLTWSHFDSLPSIKTNLDSISSYLSEITARTADKAIIYWELVAEELYFLRGKCSSYTMVFLKKVAEFS
ncbi:E3 ubiquitin-protein ligase TRIM13 isoform 2-T2 [Rhinophrynus dorsalis]